MGVSRECAAWSAVLEEKVAAKWHRQRDEARRGDARRPATQLANFDRQVQGGQAGKQAGGPGQAPSRDLVYAWLPRNARVAQHGLAPASTRSSRRYTHDIVTFAHATTTGGWMRLRQAMVRPASLLPAARPVSTDTTDTMQGQANCPWRGPSSAAHQSPPNSAYARHASCLLPPLMSV